MGNTRRELTDVTLIKIVYFDEDSASDLLEIVAGGKETASTEITKERDGQVEVEAGAKVGMNFSWLPFFGGTVDAGSVASVSAVGRNIINKTLSNTILTDYLGKLDKLQGVELLDNYTVSAREGSAAYIKMYTPYLAMLRLEELPVNFAELDDALLSAKGYYELLGQKKDDSKCILRFNIQAFRNNYALVDLGLMKLVYHGIFVGQANESSLMMASEMGSNTVSEPLNALDIVDGSAEKTSRLLDVYDVILAGVENDK